MKQKGSSIIEVLIILLIILFLVFSIFGAPLSCNWRWADSGLKSDWKWFAGCRVSLDGGKTYIPEERYRQIEE